MNPQQLGLFAPLLSQPTARASDLCTSHEAALDASLRCTANQFLALSIIAKNPCTDYDLEAITGLQKNSIGKRRSDLYKANLVAPLILNGKIFKRPGPSGSNCIVWSITPLGQAYLQNHNQPF